MKSKKIITMLLTALLTLTIMPIGAYATEVTIRYPRVTYEAHVQNVGWQDWVYEESEAGTNAQGLRVEALKIKLSNLNVPNLPTGASIQYRTHVQNIGWQNWVSDGAEAGTDGKGLRVEALEIKLVNMPGYSVQYRAHVQNIGWQDWVSDGAETGTDGKGLRVEALEIRIINNIDASLGNTSIILPPNSILSTNPVSVMGASINKATDSLTVGDTDTLIATITPLNAMNKAVIWASSNTNVATVDSNGKVTAVSGGNAIISATTVDGIITPSCAVTVTTPTTGSTSNSSTVTTTTTVGTTPTTGSTTTVVNPKLNSIVDIDAPTESKTITSSTMNITGWALDAAGIRGISVNVDGNPINSVGCSVPRPDVQKLFPQYNQLVSGYTQSEDITNLSNGIHTMTVTVDGKDGKSSTATRKINVQLPSASHENIALEKGIDPDSEFDTTNGWDVSDLNKTLDSISVQYLNNQISSAQAQQEMYAYRINLPGHQNTRVSKVYFTTNKTSETGSDGVSMFTYSGGHYNKCKIWMNADGSNTVTTIGADVTSD